ncbi:MAG TPA: ATP-binding protein [Chloroflexota bacterium]|nr:ATP-binding protein [Chloroflexota bacterium]HUM67294.1 ATP-binding protein [Chloroflexota bacterium]
MSQPIHLEQNWEHARAVAAIHAAGREIAASLDLDRTLHLVMQKAAETLPMDAGVLFIWDEASQLYRVAVSHNLPPEQVERITFAFNEGVPGWTVQHRQPLVIDDARLDARVHPTVVAAGVLSVLAVPLICREKVAGVLTLFCQTGTHAFDEVALQLAQVFADQAAVFLENARLVGKLRQWTTELERRVAERTRQLEEKQAQIIRAEKLAAVGRLAASVAHEINNPLQAIALHLQLLTDESLSPGGQRRLTVVQQEFKRIANIVERLLDLQRPKEGHPQPVDLLAALAYVIVLAEKQLQRSGIHLVQRLPDTLPAVMAVESQLKQVFLNLILNAVEAMTDGGTLTITACYERGQVDLGFADTGPGLAPEVQERLFEPFFTTKVDGSGLGLAVSHEIVTNHRGTLTVQSMPGEGATFTARLPVDGQAGD